MVFERNKDPIKTLGLGEDYYKEQLLNDYEYTVFIGNYPWLMAFSIFSFNASRGQTSSVPLDNNNLLSPLVYETLSIYYTEYHLKNGVWEDMLDGTIEDFITNETPNLSSFPSGEIMGLFKERIVNDLRDNLL